MKFVPVDGSTERLPRIDVRDDANSSAAYMEKNWSRSRPSSTRYIYF